MSLTYIYVTYQVPFHTKDIYNPELLDRFFNYKRQLKDCMIQLEPLDYKCS